MGTPAEEAGRDEDIRRAQRVLNTREDISLQNRNASVSLPDLVAQIISQNPAQDHREAATARPAVAPLRAENPDVFISYASTRRDAVIPIKDALVAKGLSVFYDFESIEGGERFADVIDEQLKKSRVILACWSGESFASSWCKNEWRVGLFRRTLVPIALEPIAFDHIPTEYNGVQYIDFSRFSGAPEDRCFVDLFRVIQRLLTRDAR